MANRIIAGLLGWVTGYIVLNEMGVGIGGLFSMMVAQFIVYAGIIWLLEDDPLDPKD